MDGREFLGTHIRVDMKVNKGVERARREDSYDRAVDNNRIPICTGGDRRGDRGVRGDRDSDRGYRARGYRDSDRGGGGRDRGDDLLRGDRDSSQSRERDYDGERDYGTHVHCHCHVCRKSFHLKRSFYQQLKDTNRNPKCLSCIGKEKDYRKKSSSTIEEYCNNSGNFKISTASGGEENCDENPIPDFATKLSLVSSDDGDNSSSSFHTPIAKSRNGQASSPLSAVQIERTERKMKKPLTEPVRKPSLLKVYCNGGARCGYQVVIADTSPITFPSHCCEKKKEHARNKHIIGTGSKCTICKVYVKKEKVDSFCLRNQHQTNFEFVLCAEKGCIITDAADVEYMFRFWCCPTCKHGVHGGVVSTYGLIVH